MPKRKKQFDLSIYHRIRHVLDGLGVSTYAFAKLIESYDSVVRGWVEQGGTYGYNITDRSVTKIVKACGKHGVTYEWLESGKGPAPHFGKAAGAAEAAPVVGLDAAAAKELGDWLDTAEAKMLDGRLIESCDAIRLARQTFARLMSQGSAAA